MDIFEKGYKYTLHDNWDGEGAIAIKPDVFKNAINIVKKYQLESLIDDSNICYNPNGTIGIEWEEVVTKNLVNIEIGLTRYSMYIESTIDKSLVNTYDGVF